MEAYDPDKESQRQKAIMDTDYTHGVRPRIMEKLFKNASAYPVVEGAMDALRKEYEKVTDMSNGTPKTPLDAMEKQWAREWLNKHQNYIDEAKEKLAENEANAKAAPPAAQGEEGPHAEQSHVPGLVANITGPAAYSGFEFDEKAFSKALAGNATVAGMAQLLKGLRADTSGIKQLADIGFKYTGKPSYMYTSLVEEGGGPPGDGGGGGVPPGFEEALAGLKALAGKDLAGMIGEKQPTTGGTGGTDNSPRTVDGGGVQHHDDDTPPSTFMRKFWVHLACFFVLLGMSLFVWIKTMPKNKTFTQMFHAANKQLQRSTGVDVIGSAKKVQSSGNDLVANVKSAAAFVSNNVASSSRTVASPAKTVQVVQRPGGDAVTKMEADQGATMK